MQTAITELLGIEYPVFQGAMAWISDADLASAVSNAGGLGTIETGGGNAELVKEEVEKAKKQTDKPFAVNIYLQNPHVDEVVDYLVNDSGVKVVTTGAGNPSKYVERFKEADIKVIPVVASVALARRMERIGAEAVIVEGTEAGGHIGKTTTMSLVPQVVDAVSIPVIAAGGIADGRTMGAALMLGADAVQVGTHFLVAKEANIHQGFKDAILKARDIDTVENGEITCHPVSVLRNQLTREYLAAEKEEAAKDEPNLERLNELLKGSLRAAVQEGDSKHGSLMAGQIAGLVREEATCQEIIEGYMVGAKKRLAEVQNFFN